MDSLTGTPTTARRNGLAQPVAIGAAGVALGLCAYAVASAPAEQRPLWAAAALAPILALIVGDARRLLLAIVVIDIPLAYDVNLDYRDDIAALGGVAGLSLSLTTIAIALLWVLAIVTPRPAPPRTPNRVRPVALPLALFVLAALASVMVARDPQLSSFEIALLVQSALVFAYVATQVRTPGEVRFVMAAILAGLALEGLIAIAGYAGFVLDVAGVTARVDTDGIRRVGGTIGGPNGAGAYFGLLLAPALAVLVAPVGRGLRWLAGVGFAVGLVGLVLTFSRGGWLGFVVSLAVLLLLGWRRGWLSPRIPAIVALALVAVAIPFGGPVADRLTSGDEGSAASRGPLAVTAARIAEDHPALGVGANNYTAVLGDYRTRDISYTWNYTVHNKYLLVLAETGVVGLAAFAWFLLATLRTGVRASRGRDPTGAIIAAGLTAGIAGQCVHMALDTFRGRPTLQGLLLIAGLLTAIAAMTRTAGDDAPREARA